MQWRISNMLPVVDKNVALLVILLVIFRFPGGGERNYRGLCGKKMVIIVLFLRSCTCLNMSRLFPSYRGEKLDYTRGGFTLLWM